MDLSTFAKLILMSCTVAVRHTTRALSLFRVLFVHVDNLLHLVVATHEDTGSVVDMLRHDCQHTLHAAVDRLATGCSTISVTMSRTHDVKLGKRTVLEDHSHWRTFI